MNAHVVIAGAGQAGGRTAQALRRLGYTGRITLVGDETLPPYERPPLSKDVLLGRADISSLALLAKEDWAGIGVDLRLDVAVREIERDARSVQLGDGMTLAYDQLVIATGARARGFPGLVDPATEVLQLRSVADAARIAPELAPGRHVGVIGAGFIGLELAATARALGAAVTLVEAAPRPLARLLPAEFAAQLVALHRERGVQLHLGVAVERLTSSAIHLADGHRIDVDAIVVGIGAQANDEIAAAAGLAVRDGVVVDACGRSSDPHIFAVGDVARHVDPGAGLDHRLESWRNAEDGAVAVASAILGLAPPAPSVPWFWTNQYGQNIQIAGRPQDTHRRHCATEATTGPRIVYYLDAEDRIRGVIGVDCPREIRGAMKLMQSDRTVTVSELPVPRPRPQALALEETSR